MSSIKIVLDPEKLANPDLDIRYKLPDDIIAKFGGGILIDDGYDYEEPGSLLAIFLRSALELPAESIDRIVQLACSHDSLGEPLGPAMRIYADGRRIFPECDI